MSEQIKCSVCGKPADVFVSLVMGGKVQSVAFCKEHAEEAGVFSASGYGYLDPPSEDNEPQVRPPRPGVLQCKVCGFTQDDFEKYGRFGCSSCYETFATALKPLLKKMHIGTSHMGKIPRKAMKQTLLNNRLKQLENQLETAVASERYEEAAHYRDKITEIKQLELGPEN